MRIPVQSGQPATCVSEQAVNGLGHQFLAALKVHAAHFWRGLEQAGLDALDGAEGVMPHRNDLEREGQHILAQAMADDRI